MREKEFMVIYNEEVQNTINLLQDTIKTINEKYAEMISHYKGNKRAIREIIKIYKGEINPLKYMLNDIYKNTIPQRIIKTKDKDKKINKAL